MPKSTLARMQSSHDAADVKRLDESSLECADMSAPLKAVPQSRDRRTPKASSHDRLNNFRYLALRDSHSHQGAIDFALRLMTDALTPMMQQYQRLRKSIP